MEFASQRLIEHPRIGAATALILTLVFAVGISSLTVTSNPDKALDSDDPDVQFYENFRANFPEEVSLSILILADDVYRIPVLETIARLAEASTAIEGIARVESLSTTRAFGIGDYGVDYRPLLRTIPESEDEARSLRQRVAGNIFLNGILVNEAETAAAIHLIVDSRSPEPPSDRDLVRTVETLLERERSVLGKEVRLFQIGDPYLKVEESRSVLHDAATLTPIAIVLVLFVLWVFFRSLSAVLLPLATGILSITATLGFMGWLGFPLTPLSSTVPTLLMVVGCTEDIHLLSEYAAGIRSGLSRSRALKRMVAECRIPIQLTSLTTLIGFLVLSVNGIAYLREYAVIASFGILINFVITVCLAPAIIRSLPPPRPFGKRDFLNRFGFLQHRRAVGFAACLALMTAIAAGSFRVVVTSDPLTFFFNEKSEVRERYRLANESFDGVNSLCVVVETYRDRGAQELETLETLQAFSDRLGEHFTGIRSFPDAIHFLHDQFLEAGFLKAEYRELTNAHVARYRTMLSEPARKRLLDYNASRTVLYVPTRTTDSREIARQSDLILKHADELPGTGFEVAVTGPLATYSRVANDLARDLARDLTICSIAILILISVFFRSPRLGLLAVVPNVIPLLVTFGLMGWIGTPLSIGTYPIALIVISIAVNDTVHFFSRFVRLQSADIDSSVTAREVVEAEFTPIVCSSIAMALGFLVFGLAESITIRNSGYLISGALLSALVADLLITPSLLAKAFDRKNRPGRPAGESVAG